MLLYARIHFEMYLLLSIDLLTTGKDNHWSVIMPAFKQPDKFLISATAETVLSLTF